MLRHPQSKASDPNRRQGFKTIEFAPSDQSIVYAGLSKNVNNTIAPQGVAIYKSTDAGATFSAMPSPIDGNNVSRLVVDPSNANIVYAATSTGVYKSTDGAATWSSMTGLSGCKIEALAVAWQQPGMMIAGEQFGGTWITLDGGFSWSGPHASGFSSPNPFLSALAIDPAASNTVFASDQYSGVYQSTDGGINWAPFPGWRMSS